MGIAAPAIAALCSAAMVLIAFSADAPTRFAARAAWRAERLVRAAIDGLTRSRAVEAALSLDAARQAVEGLRKAVGKRGLVLSSAEGGALLIVCAAASSLLGAVLLWSWIGAAAGLAVFIAGAAMRVSRTRNAHAQALSQDMPAVFRSLAVSLGAGLTLSQAIAYAGSRENSVAAPAFAQCSLRLMCGESYDDALDALAAELPTQGIGLLSSALAISHQTGSPLQGLFTRSALLIERAGELERLLSVKTAQVRLSVRVVCLLPAILVLLLAAISPDFQHGLTTPIGIGSLAMAAVMDGAAVMIVRRMAKEIDL